MRNSARLLRAGGVAMHTTELMLSSLERSLDHTGTVGRRLAIRGREGPWRGVWVLRVVWAAAMISLGMPRASVHASSCTQLLDACMQSS